MDNPYKRLLSKDLEAALDELQRWAITPKRLAFIKYLVEYFEPTDLVLVVRAMNKSKLLAAARSGGEG